MVFENPHILFGRWYWKIRKKIKVIWSEWTLKNSKKKYIFCRKKVFEKFLKNPKILVEELSLKIHICWSEKSIGEFLKNQNYLVANNYSKKITSFSRKKVFEKYFKNPQNLSENPQKCQKIHICCWYDVGKFLKKF